MKTVFARDGARIWRVMTTVALSALCACGYTTSSRTAKGIKSIAVPFFENQTSEPSLEITFTEKLVQSLVDDNTLKVTDEEYADAVLAGTIVTFENRPFSFNPDLNAEEYHVIIRVRVSLFNRRDNEPIWADATMTGDGAYFIDAPESENSFEDAVAEAVREITEEVLNKTVQDW